MESNFNEVKAHITTGLPFVMYRKPSATTIKAWLQNDMTLHHLQNYSSKGFVIAPFDIKLPIFLFPQEKCRVIECTIPIKQPDLFLTIQPASIAKTEFFHKKIVSKAVRAIEKGAFSKVVLSRVHKITFSENPLNHLPELFLKLQQLYPTATVYCWYHPSFGCWMGATPENLFTVKGNSINTMALAGTQKVVAQQETVWADKEREEQQLVTDFIVRQLQPLTKQLEIGEQHTARAGNLWHLKTQISGKLNILNDDIEQIVAALHPTPAVCGVPRLSATSFINENENYNRSLYTGFFGELQTSASLKADFYVNLRCMQLLEKAAEIYVGGGITHASLPHREWEETIHKAMTMQKVFE
ncbi:MAG TPA: chorismate-binding protein [Flavobacteriaceae bacterium]|nr:chorismate-binding protein [Flavobacteriaceae bacterium]